MVARAENRAEPKKDRAGADGQAGDKIRDASFGIVVAVICATLLWAALIALCFEFL